MVLGAAFHGSCKTANGRHSLAQKLTASCSDTCFIAPSTCLNGTSNPKVMTEGGGEPRQDDLLAEIFLPNIKKPNKLTTLRNWLSASIRETLQPLSVARDAALSLSPPPRPPRGRRSPKADCCDAFSAKKPGYVRTLLGNLKIIFRGLKKKTGDGAKGRERC